MGLVGTVILVAAVAGAAPSGAAMRGAALPAGPGRAEPVQFACGPGRCDRRPFWRYGGGLGFQPFRGANPPPPRAFGYPPLAFGRLGRMRRPAFRPF